MNTEPNGLKKGELLNDTVFANKVKRGLLIVVTILLFFAVVLLIH